MPTFSYTAVADSGERVSGQLTSRTRHEALGQLVSRGCHPMRLDRADAAAGGPNVSLELLRRVTPAHLAVFTRQLASLLKAGLPMIRALKTLAGQIENPTLRRILHEIVASVSREGGTLSDGLDEHPRVFDPVYRGIVRAGEEGGNLPAVLQSLAVHLSRGAKLRRLVIGAFIYPAFLMLLGTAAIFILTAFVIPRFEELFESFGQNLPWLTRALLAVSGVLAGWWWALLLGFAATAAAGIASLRREAVRLRVDAALLRVPVIRGMLIRLEIHRVARTLAALLASGVRVLAALSITRRTAKNRAIKASFEGVIRDVSQGEPVADALERAKLYPPMVVHLVRTGEETGELPEMLREIADIYEDEAERAVDGAVKLIEPVLIVIMGGIVAGIVAAVMLPIFQANVMAN